MAGFGKDDDLDAGFGGDMAEMARKRRAQRTPETTPFGNPKTKAGLKQQDEQLAAVGGGVGSIWGPLGAAIGSNVGRDASRVTSGRGGEAVSEHIKNAFIPLYHPASMVGLVGDKTAAEKGTGIAAGAARGGFKKPAAGAADKPQPDDNGMMWSKDKLGGKQSEMGDFKAPGRGGAMAAYADDDLTDEELDRLFS